MGRIPGAVCVFERLCVRRAYRSPLEESVRFSFCPELLRLGALGLGADVDAMGVEARERAGAAAAAPDEPVAAAGLAASAGAPVAAAAAGTAAEEDDASAPGVVDDASEAVSSAESFAASPPEAARPPSSADAVMRPSAAVIDSGVGEDDARANGVMTVCTRARPPKPTPKSKPTPAPAPTRALERYSPPGAPARSYDVPFVGSARAACTPRAVARAAAVFWPSTSACTRRRGP